jgi:DNA-binding NarL/FixJ family response regulator
MKKIKIAIADDYMIFREGLKVSLAQDEAMQVIFEAENGEDLIAALETKKPDIIIMDLKMPIMDGMEATQIIRKRYKEIKVLVVSIY